MRTGQRAALLLTAIAAGCAAGPSYRLNLKPYQLEATDFPLPSGLRVLFQEDRGQPSVVVTSVIDSGSSDDPAGKEGMAHLIEHLCFRAIHGDNPKVMDHLKQLGAVNFNASTGDDFTDYYTVAPKEALLPLLRIEALRLLDPIAGVTEKDLEIEREVVRNELRLRTETTVSNKIYELSKAMVFPEGHVYHRTGIGTHESLDSITLDDVRAWLKEHYVPANTTIVVAGDFDRSQAGALLSRTFPLTLVAGPDAKPDQRLQLAKPEPRVRTPSEPPPPVPEKTLARIVGPVTRDTVVLAWSLPGAYRDDEPLIEITVQTMGIAIGSLLYPESEDKDRIEGLGCFPVMNRHASMALCYIELAEGQEPEEIAGRAVDGLWELWNTDNEGWQRQLFSQARASYQAALFRDSASILRAVPVAHHLHFRGRADMFSRSIERVDAISAFDARDFAYEYLTRERVARLVIRPYDANKEPAAAVAFSQGSSWAGATLEAGTGDFAGVTNAQIEKLALAPDVKQARTLTLSNGLRVVLKRHGGAPFVKVALYTGGGRRSSTPWGLPDFAFPVFDARNPGQIAGVWAGGGYGDGTLVGVETPSGNLDAALDLVHDRVTSTRSNWSRKAFDLTSKRLERRLRTDEKRPEIWAERALWSLVLPDHPYGRNRYDFDALRKLGADDYRSWFDRQLTPRNATLFVVGDIDLDATAQKVGAVWSAWRSDRPGGPMPGYPAPPARPARQIALLDNPEGTQTSLSVACHLAPATGTNDAASEVLTGLLREDLWAAIRERSGASYGVQVYADHASGGLHVLRVGSFVQNDKAKPALQTILDRLRDVQAGKVTPAKLAETKWQLAAATHTANLSVDEMLYTLIGLVRDGQPLESLSGYPKRLGSVAAEDLSALLKPCAGHEVVTAMGPEAAIRKPLESLGIPLEIVDWRKGADAKAEVGKE